MTATATTLLFDTEFSSASYVDLYADQEGTKGPLWGKIPAPVVGVYGELGQGKTTFILDIAGGPVRRIGVFEEMQKCGMSAGRPMDVFLWWYSAIKALPAGRFRVIGVDVAEHIEAGLADWVWENPLYFQHTKNQYMKMSGIYWGDVSSYLRLILGELAAKCETFAFANHMGDVWSDSKPTGAKKAKGKRILKEMASLYIRLQKPKDMAGNVGMIPAGSVDLADGGKSRLMCRVMRGGVSTKVPALPPRFPVATPDAIRAFILSPPDYSHLSAEQVAPEARLTDDQRIEMRLNLARAEAEAEMLRIQRIQEERGGHGGPTVGANACAVATDELVEYVEHDTNETAETDQTTAPEPTTHGPTTAPSANGTPTPPSTAPTSTTPPSSDADTGTPRQTLQEAIATAAPLPAPKPDPTAPPPPMNGLPQDTKTAVIQLWEEFAHLSNMQHAEKEAAWALTLKHFGAATTRELTMKSLTTIRNKLVEKVRGLYTERGVQCPF